MPEAVSCPACSRQLRLPREVIGSEVRCPMCQTSFFTRAASNGSAEAVSSPEAVRPLRHLGEEHRSLEPPSSERARASAEGKKRIGPVGWLVPVPLGIPLLALAFGESIGGVGGGLKWGLLGFVLAGISFAVVRQTWRSVSSRAALAGGFVGLGYLLLGVGFLFDTPSSNEPHRDSTQVQTTERLRTTRQNGKDVVVFTVRDFGRFEAELYADRAPLTVRNFLRYVDEGHYDGTIFHRVVPDFVIQGGHFNRGFAQARRYQEAQALGKRTHGNVRNEARNGLSNTRGTIAMARQHQPHTASDQFFINVVDNSEKLDPDKLTDDGYAVFGKVIKGMEVVDAISKIRTMEESPSGHQAVPVEDVIIESVRRDR